MTFVEICPVILSGIQRVLRLLEKVKQKMADMALFLAGIFSVEHGGGLTPRNPALLIVTRF